MGCKPFPTAKNRNSWHLTTVKISPQFYDLAKKSSIKFSEAMRVGLSILFAEKGIKEYDNKLNLYRKMQQFRTMAEAYSTQYHELLKVINQKEGIEIKRKNETNQ